MIDRLDSPLITRASGLRTFSPPKSRLDARDHARRTMTDAVPAAGAAPDSPVETLASPPSVPVELPASPVVDPPLHEALAPAPAPAPLPESPLPDTPAIGAAIPPTDAEPVVEAVEQRVLRPRVAKPAPRGILKPSTVAPSRFSFRRDILQPFNTRLAYAGYPLPTGEPASPAPASTGVGPAAAVQAVGSAAAAAGSFWGSALKRLTVVTNAAVAGASGVPLLVDDAVHASPTAIATPAPEHEGESGPPAPHTPAKGVATALPPAASPYATIRASTSATPPTPAPPPLSVAELKKVRFRMATLKVIYPINGPNGPLAPWEEGKTKKRSAASTLSSVGRTDID